MVGVGELQAICVALLQSVVIAVWWGLEGEVYDDAQARPQVVIAVWWRLERWILLIKSEP